MKQQRGVWKFFAFVLVALQVCSIATAAEKVIYEEEFIFPLEHWHNHSSSIVELPGGDLLVCWYHGSGERQADDVVILASRKPKGATKWSELFLLADTPNFPDTNPVLFVDSRSRLWLLWPVILANEWHTALMKYRITTDYPLPGVEPSWDLADNLLFIPRNFEQRVRTIIEPQLATEKDERLRKYMELILQRAADNYFRRLGWMTRTHPLELPSGRILVPLYSDGFSFSIIAITDDGGRTWTSSEPIVGAGSIQPSLVRRKDGTLVAYMRDNGPPPKRVHISFSKDDGVTWTPAVDTEIPNPGSSLEVIVTREGYWLMVYNDTERGRHSLAVALSDDEGRSWKWKRHLELDRRSQGAGSFHYPSVIQASDGTIHVTYSYFLNHLPQGAPRKTIKHVRFNLEWVKQGDPEQVTSTAP